MDLEVCAWPPNRYGSPFRVKPRRYWLETTSDVGVPEPDEVRVDTREQETATIVIRPPGEQTLGMRAHEEPGPSIPLVESSVDNRRFLLERRPRGLIRASTLEPQATVELDQLDPPYRHWSSVRRFEQGVTAGAYRIRFRLGLDIYSEGELDVRAGMTLNVRPTIGRSPLVQAMLGEDKPPEDAVISETIGPIQAGVLQTVLPIVGIKPFDATGELFHQFDRVVRRLDARDFGMRPVSVVVAVDGNDWHAPWPEVLASIRCELSGAGDLHALDLHGVGTQDGRIGLAVGRAPAGSFVARIESPHLGSIRAAGVSLPDRATVVTLAVRPDGSFDFSQSVLRIPGVVYAEPVPDVPYGRMLRELQLGLKLYASGELLAHWTNVEELRQLFEANRTDPVLSCAAYYAWVDAGRPGGVGEIRHVADNLFHYFEGLPDSRVVHALEREEVREEVLVDLLAAEAMPLLARSALELAAFARATGRDDHSIVGLTRRIAFGQPWLLVRDARSEATAAPLVAAT